MAGHMATLLEEEAVFPFQPAERLQLASPRQIVEGERTRHGSRSLTQQKLLALGDAPRYACPPDRCAAQALRCCRPTATTCGGPRLLPLQGHWLTSSTAKSRPSHRALQVPPPSCPMSPCWGASAPRRRMYSPARRSWQQGSRWGAGGRVAGRRACRIGTACCKTQSSMAAAIRSGGEAGYQVPSAIRCNTLCCCANSGNWAAFSAPASHPPNHLQPPVRPFTHPNPLQPYRISFDSVACGSIFHQCVYVLCALEADTMQVRRLVRLATS